MKNREDLEWRQPAKSNWIKEVFLHSNEQSKETMTMTMMNNGVDVNIGSNAIIKYDHWLLPNISMQYRYRISFPFNSFIKPLFLGGTLSTIIIKLNNIGKPKWILINGGN